MIKFLLFVVALSLTQIAQASRTNPFEFDSPINALVFGGRVVKKEDSARKHLVALLSEGSFSCTGFILDNDLVLTAAHCINDDLSLSFGLRVTETTEKRAVIKAIRNPAYNPYTFEDANDIAVISFAGGLPADYEPAMVPTQRNDLNAGDEVTVIGYGITTKLNPAQGAGTLRKTTVTVQNPRFASAEFTVDQTKGSGACRGDSGGPLLKEVRGKFVAYGVTNRFLGQDCGSEIVYADVGAQHNWIQAAVQSLRGE